MFETNKYKPSDSDVSTFHGLYFFKDILLFSVFPHFSLCVCFQPHLVLSSLTWSHTLFLASHHVVLTIFMSKAAPVIVFLSMCITSLELLFLQHLLIHSEPLILSTPTSTFQMHSTRT